MRIRPSSFLKQFYNRSTWNLRFCTSVSKETDASNAELDPAPLFFDWQVKELLQTITRVDYKRAFRERKDGSRLSSSEYKFMTDEELEKSKWQARKKLGVLLQMPPVVKAQPDTTRVLYKDPALEGLTDSKLVFTDISYGYSNQDRLIVVREPDGTLRHANRNERHRMNQAYFPMDGREFHVPKMFYEPYFTDLLKKEEYEFILDRACLQFEPDDPQYHRITKEVYFAVNAENKFDKLRSTRHFGPLAFHLAWERKIDNLLIDVIQGKKLDEAVALIRVYHKIHPEAKSAKSIVNEDDASLIKRYAKLDSSQRNRVEYALLTYEKLQKEKEEVDVNVNKAHGFADDYKPKDK